MALALWLVLCAADAVVNRYVADVQVCRGF